MCSSEGLCLLSVMHCTMGAPSPRASHSGDCPSSLLPDGVSLPAGGTGDPTVYISAGDGVHLPECDTNTMEGGLAIRPWRVGLGLMKAVTQSSMRFCTLVIHRVIQTVCSAHHTQSRDNNNGHVHMNSGVVLPSSAGYLVTKIQCHMHPPLPHHGY